MSEIVNLVDRVSAGPGLPPERLRRLRRDLGRFLADVDLAILQQYGAVQRRDERRRVGKPGQGQDYLSLRDLAAYSGLSARTLRGYVDLPPGEALPVFRVGGKILVKVSDFDRWLEQFRAQGRPSLARAVREMGLDRI